MEEQSCSGDRSRRLCCTDLECDHDSGEIMHPTDASAAVATSALATARQFSGILV